MGRDLMPQLREDCGKDPMFLCKILGRSNFKACSENSYQKGIMGKEFLNYMAIATREKDGICFDIYTNWTST